MSVSINKIPRGERNRRDQNIGEETSSNSFQEILGNGDTEIFSTLIPLMEDLDVLKTCRLVCKSWNQFACRAMRKLPWVYFTIDESQPLSIENHLKLILINKKLGLPSPIGNFQVMANNFRNEPFLRFLKYVRGSANNYYFELRISSISVDPADLITLLTTNQNNFKITKLFLSASIFEDGPSADIFQPDKIRLPFLKSLEMGNDRFINDRILKWCGNLCQHSPIKSVKIRGTTSAEKLKILLSPGGMRAVENLYLTFAEPISSEDWKYICGRKMEIPCIKKLQMYVRRLNFIECYFGGFEAIFERFADSLESIAGDVLPILKNNSFPKLREINYKRFVKFDSEFAFPVERFPLLNRVTFVVGNDHALDCPRVEEQSLGIEELSFHYTGLLDCPDDFLKFMWGAGKLFPNVSSLCIIHAGDVEFTSTLLIVICKSFPKLTSLELRVVIMDDKVLSGLRVDVDEWLPKGWSLENIPREASLLDFPGLKKLTLGPYVYITKHLFLCCLSKMSKLQSLTFSLNGDVSAEDIQESVGHLKRITVVILQSQPLIVSPKEQWRVEMERLRIMLPSVVEIKKKDRELPERVMMSF